MKRLIISLAAATIATAAASATVAASSDSIISIDNARRVVVTEQNGTVAVSVACPDTTLTFVHAATQS
ncbi:MAG: hypothetical protein K2G82_08860, partial [Paramuribaculum sp.]|nr:hypothetical protein [Paramuribaculum sp.]